MESTSAPGQYKSAYKKYNRWNKWNNKNKESAGNGENSSAQDHEGAGQKTALLPSASSNTGSYNSYPANTNNVASGSGPEASFDLGKNKRVTVRQFRNVNLIDIREYYKDSAGELRPGKKGISLTEEMFDSMLSNYRNIDDALRRLGSNRAGALEASAFSSSEAGNTENNSNPSNGEQESGGRLLIDNSGTVKNDETNNDHAVAGIKRENLDGDDEKIIKKSKESTSSATPAPPQQEQQKKVEELESSANLVIPTKPVAKQEAVDSDDDFANDLENELAS